MQKRNKRIHFLVSEEEEQAIKQKMDEMDILNRNAYLRKMALNGYCIKLDLSDLTEIRSLLRICSNNLNQYAKKANATGNVYREDLEDLQERLDEIWNEVKKITERLAAIS